MFLDLCAFQGLSGLLSSLGLGGAEPCPSQCDSSSTQEEELQQQREATETAADMLEQLQGLSTTMMEMQGSVSQLSSRLGSVAVMPVNRLQSQDSNNI